MAKIRIKLNHAGIAALMKRSETKEILRSYAERARDGAGDGYELSEYTGRSRANVSVYPGTPEARRDNRENNTLLKAVKNL